MRKAIIEYMKRHFDWTYNFNISSYTFYINDLTTRALRIEPFIRKYFNSTWEIMGNAIYMECHYYDYDMH